MHEPFIVGIGGGTGSGKSTIARMLAQREPERYAVLHLDDYFRPESEVPKKDGFTDWDSPEALRFDDLLRDLESLHQGKSITVLTESELYNPEFDIKKNNKIEQRIDPKPILIIEGYLVFYDQRIRELIDLKIYLDIPIRESLQRRTKFVDLEYYEHVLIPAHERYVEPTRQYADVLLPVHAATLEEVYTNVRATIEEKLIPSL